MSYAKAMKHARNVKKCRKQANMHFGFDTNSGHWPASSERQQLAHQIFVMYSTRNRPCRTPENRIWLRAEIRRTIDWFRAEFGLETP